MALERVLTPPQRYSFQNLSLKTTILQYILDSKAISRNANK